MAANAHVEVWFIDAWPFNCKLGGVNARWELLRLRYGDTWVGGKGEHYKASREVEREKKQVDLPRGQSTLPGASNTSV